MRFSVVAVCLSVVTLALFAPTRGYGFVYEDGRDIDALVSPTTLLEQATVYPLRGVATVSKALDSWLWGGSPEGFHIGAMAWHLANVLLALGLFWQVLPPWGAVLAAGLFAWHPVQVETVAYVSSRPDLLAGFGLLLALLAASLGSLPGALVGVVLASLAKETAAVAWGLVWLWAAATDAPLSLKKWTAVACGGAIVGLAVIVWRLDDWTVAISPPMMGEQFAVIAALVSSLILPWGLTIDPDWSWAATVWPVGLITGLLLTCWAATLGWQRRSRLAFAWLWTVVALGPRLIVPLHEGLHYHHLYPVMIGWCLSAGHWVTGTRAEA